MKNSQILIFLCVLYLCHEKQSPDLHGFAQDVGFASLDLRGRLRLAGAWPLQSVSDPLARLLLGAGAGSLRAFFSGKVAWGRPAPCPLCWGSLCGSRT